MIFRKIGTVGRIPADEDTEVYRAVVLCPGFTPALSTLMFSPLHLYSSANKSMKNVAEFFMLLRRKM